MTTVRQIESGQPSSTVHIGATAFLGVLLSSGRGGDQNGNGFGNGGDGTGGNDGNGTGGNGTGGNGGATVSGVVSGGTAARAGLVAGDVITRLDGHAIDSANTLSRVMSGLHPGDRVRLGWLDGTGSSRSATARLDAGPPA
jgi:S1-C subfamily serine protease